jgi:Flp pilus assembly protein TadB
MSMNLILAIAGAAAAGLLVVLIVVLIARNAKDKDPETKYRGQLESILSGADEYDGDGDDDSSFNKISLFGKWNQLWGRNLAEVSDQFSKDDPKGGIFAAVLWVTVMALVTIFLGNPIAGAVLASGVLGLIFVVLKTRASKKDDVVRNQLTGFLFAMKANISASETPERALMKVIDKMPSPLYDQLLPAKSQILSNVGFGEAMASLQEETTSEDLRFLCACMIQATSTGVSLEDQIDIILQAVEQKRRTTEEISQATKSANMSMYGAGIIIPFGFIGIYILDERSRAYWFVEPMSWVALGVAVAISFVGIRQARKFVAKVREL